MVVAARKYYKTDEDLRAKFNAETGQVDVYAVRAIVGEIADPKKEMTLAEARKMDPQTEIGGELLIPKPTAVLGRIAAQTAKQVIMQRCARRSATPSSTNTMDAWANWSIAS